MSVGESQPRNTEFKNASRMRKVAEAAGAGILGLMSTNALELLGAGQEIGIAGGGAVFLVAYNSLKSFRRRNAGNS